MVPEGLRVRERGEKKDSIWGISIWNLGGGADWEPRGLGLGERGRIAVCWLAIRSVLGFGRSNLDRAIILD